MKANWNVLGVQKGEHYVGVTVLKVCTASPTKLIYFLLICYFVGDKVSMDPN